jgi:hypothetical protein
LAGNQQLEKSMAGKANGKSNTEGLGTTAGHNAQARTEAMQKAFAEMYACDEQIEAAIEKYVKPYRESKSDTKARMKDEYGIPPKLLNARYNAYKIERDAAKAQDDATVDIIRELYDALPIGGIVDLVDAAKPKAA